LTRRIDTVATSRSDAHAPSPVTRHCSLERHVCILSTSINRNYRVACLQTRPYFWATSVFPWRARNNNALQRLCAGKQRSAMHTVRVLTHGEYQKRFWWRNNEFSFSFLSTMQNCQQCKT